MTSKIELPNLNENSVKIDKDRLIYLESLEKEKELQKLKEELPHLYLHPLYTWQKEFIETTHKQVWICCSNQVGKTSAQIIKMIRLATEQELWSKYFSRRPTTFLYFYPSVKLASKEFAEKWEKVYLPKGDMKKHPRYGWEEDIRQKEIYSIKFNSGVTIYFMSYKMDAQDMQAMTIDYVGCDEELPQEIYPEIAARLLATDGMFSCVFIATLGQDWMRRIIEGEGKERVFQDSFRRQLSMYECQKYADGTPTKFTNEYIEKFKKVLPNETEIQRRVYGKFVVAGGLVFPNFDRNRHFKDSHKLPKDWETYVGIDMGSGGEDGHPAAIVFVSVNSEHTKGRVIDCWRGDDVITTASDILQKYREMKEGRAIISACYDFSGSGVDFGTIVDRAGEPFERAIKRNREQGIDTLNVLFKNDMLTIFNSGDARKLIEELTTLKIEMAKTKAKDDLIDALKYCIGFINWDFTCLNREVPEEIEEVILDPREKLRQDQLKGIKIKEPEEKIDSIIEELDDWNDYLS
jgi:hypothetical protein